MPFHTYEGWDMPDSLSTLAPMSGVTSPQQFNDYRTSTPIPALGDQRLPRLSPMHCRLRDPSFNSWSLPIGSAL